MHILIAKPIKRYFQIRYVYYMMTGGITNTHSKDIFKSEKKYTNYMISKFYYLKEIQPGYILF